MRVRANHLNEDGTRRGTPSPTPSFARSYTSHPHSPFTSILPLLSAGLSGTRSSENPVRGNGSGLDGRGGITWWRSFRFPPVDRSNVPAARIPVPGLTEPSASESLGDLGSPTSHESAETGSPSGGAPDEQLVPIILVGLQSVDSSDVASVGPGISRDDMNPTGASRSDPPDPFHRDGQRNITRQLSEILGSNSPGALNEPQSSTGNIDGQTYMIFVLGGN